LFARKEKGVKVDGVGNANLRVRYIRVLKKKSGGGEEGGGGGRVGVKDDYGDDTFVHADAMQATKVKLEHSAQGNSGGDHNKKHQKGHHGTKRKIIKSV
jgi:hypothetical protein